MKSVSRPTGGSDTGSRGSKDSRCIILLVPGFPPNEAATDCLPALGSFVKALTGRNPHIAIHVIAFQYPFESGRYAWHGATVHALAGRNRRFPMRLATWLRAAWRAWRLARWHRVVALHSHWFSECAYVASWLARLTGAPHIVTIHGQDALSDNPYFRRLPRLPLDGTTITACSDKAAAAFHGSTGRSVDHVVPIGLEPEARAAPRGTAARSVDIIDILGVGSLSPAKNFAVFIEIVAELAASDGALRSVIVGDGPERPLLEASIQRRGLEDVVRLAGHLPREQVLTTMRRSRILLHTARYEGQGYVFLEALASGMRVVCHDVGYTGNGTGVYRCESNAEMTDALRKLLRSPMDPLEVNVPGIDETAEAFEKIYGIL